MNSANHAYWLALLLLCVVMCALPVPWVAFPAAVLLVLFIPGALLLRTISPVMQHRGAFFVALALSALTISIPLTWTWRVTNDRWVVLMVAAGSNLSLWLMGLRWALPISGDSPRIDRGTNLVFGGFIGWIALCAFLNYYLPTAGDRVETVAAHDYTKHHAILLSLERSAIPLKNYFYAGEPDTPYYYYEHYYVLVATLRKLAQDQISIPFALGVACAYSATMLIGLTFYLAYRVLGTSRGALMATGCVCVIGGFDIVPVLIRAANGGPMVVTLDSWIPPPWRIHNLATNFMWCPHHITGVVGVTLCAYLLSIAPRAKWWLILAPVLGASLFGTSVYTSIPIFLGAALYVSVRLWLTRRDRIRLHREIGAFAIIAVLGFVLMIYSAWQYATMGSRYSGGHTISWDRFPYAVFGRLIPPSPLANYLDAPWIILIEWGIAGVACLVVTRAWWRTVLKDEGIRLLALAGLVGTITMFTVRSRINPIDYSFRVGIMPAMVLAAIVAGALFDRENVRHWARKARWPMLVAGITVGLSVGFYEAPLAATRSLLRPETAKQDAAAIRFLAKEIPEDAIIQASPSDRVDLVQLTNRQMGVTDPKNAHVVVFAPLDQNRMEQCERDIRAAFESTSAEQAYSLLDKWSITHVLVGTTEQDRFGQLPQFDDRGFFEVIFNDGNAKVYYLRK